MLKSKFDDCPYHCNNGKVLDYELRKLVPCPHCSERKSELARQGLGENSDGDIEPLCRILGVNNPYLEARFVYDSVVPEEERVFLDEDSVSRQKDLLEEIYLGLTVGELPDNSYCFGLGNKGRVDRFAYPMLAKAYLSGIDVARFISCLDYNRLCINMSDEIEQFLEKDLVIMLIQDGATKADLLSAKGLMQSRALRGKGTIFVTTWSIEACSTLLGYFNDKNYFSASGSFVEYKVSKKKHSHYINQLTGETNDMYVDDNGVDNANMVSMNDLLK